jgi:S1-C subfamily serine protease
VYKKYSENMMMQLPQPGAAQVGQHFKVAVGGPHMRGPMMGGTQIEALGATVMPVFDQFVRAQLGEGVIVIKVGKDSAAERVGLQRHDLIKSVNGNEVKTIEELQEAVEGAEKVGFDVVRAGKPMKLEDK